MKVLAVLFALVAAAYAGIIAPTTLVRTPSLDSAVIQSDRLGGNFAYSSVEGHAYAAVSPVVQNVVSPVGVSYSATPYLTPINYFSSGFVQQPAILPGSIVGAPSIISPVAPGIVAPGLISTIPNQLIVPGVVPLEGKPAEVPIAEAQPAVEALPVAPVEAAPAPQPEEAPLSDDSVSVESA